MKANATIKDMTRGNPAKLLFFFAVPLMVGNLFQQMYSMVDTIIVGQGVGVGALASLGAADWLNWLFIGLATGLTQGFSILMAQNYGAGDLKRLKKTVGVSVTLTVIASVIFVLMAEGLITVCLNWMNTPEDIYGGAVLYLRIMFAGLPIILFYNLAASVLRALGDSKSPLYAMILAALINIGLDLLFVLVLQWGIAGAAAATVIAQMFSLFYCLNVMKRIEILRLDREDFYPEKHMTAHLLKLGMPVMFQNIVISVGGMVVQSVINKFGFLFVAGFTATNKLYGLLEMAAISFGSAMTTYTGQNLGAGKLKRIQNGMKSAVVMAFGTSVAVSILMLVLGRPILSLFVSGDASQTEQVLDIAYHYLKVMSYFLVILYALHIYRCALQGLGDTVTPMVSGIAEFTMRVTAALLLPKLIGQNGIFYAEIMAWTGAAVILVSAYYIEMHALTSGRKKLNRTLLPENSGSDQNGE
ncbi:MAG: MATE family efflux transporter [Fusicatenibacter sp.]|nr:MATE family efflux transporter [Lachnospiraceae bacterium]MDY2938622.1 MATE family efflux transporter [Fusicatenibacter sp.]